MDKLNKGGILAVQMPNNSEEPLMQIMDNVVSRDEWGFRNMETNEILTLAEYYDILSSCASKFDIWETVYFHTMPDINAMIEWVKGTRLRPYLNALDNERADALIKEITDRAATEYTPRSNGEMIFKFRRIFFIALK